MSYCRFSCDDGKSDVYVYESDAGWVTHVASHRIVGHLRAPPPIPAVEASADARTAWTRAYQKYNRALDAKPRAPIGGPHDGETFTDHSAGACLRRLLNLSSDGYHVPAHALKALAEEVEEPPT